MVQAPSTGTQLIIQGKKVYFAGTIAGNKISGDPIEFVPNKYNLLQALMGDESNDPVTASTLTYTIYVTPRYSLV